MYKMASAEERACMELLASKVRNELAAAGLPVIAPNIDPILLGGAEVNIDDGADTSGGVFVSWSASPRLRECTQRAFRLRQLDDPIRQHSGKIAAAMMQAMAAILTSAGFIVDDANNDYRTHQLRVVRGPTGPDELPMWSLRDDELAMPGWHTDAPGDGGT